MYSKIIAFTADILPGVYKLELGDIPVLYRNDDILFIPVSISSLNFIPGNRYTVEYCYTV